MFKYLRVLKRLESSKIIRRDHRGRHDGHNAVEGRLAHRFMVTNLREMVVSVGGNNCSICAVYEPIKKKSVPPIITERKGQLVMFDLAKFYVPV